MVCAMADAEIELGLILRPTNWKRRKDLHFELPPEPLALPHAIGSRSPAPAHEVTCATCCPCHRDLWREPVR